MVQNASRCQEDATHMCLPFPAASEIPAVPALRGWERRCISSSILVCTLARRLSALLLPLLPSDRVRSSCSEESRPATAPPLPLLAAALPAAVLAVAAALPAVKLPAAKLPAAGLPAECSKATKTTALGGRRVCCVRYCWIWRRRKVLHSNQQ